MAFFVGWGLVLQFSKIVGIMGRQCNATLMKLINTPYPKPWVPIVSLPTNDARPRHFILSLANLRVHDRILKQSTVA